MEINVANTLTILRLVLVPFFVAAFVLDRGGEAFAIFCVAGFTDLIDGTVARLLKQPSKSGALLDPIADKLLMQSCFIALAVGGILPIWFFAVAFARDVMITAGIIYIELKHIDIAYSASWVSKCATLFQLAVAVLGLLMWWKPSMVFESTSILVWYQSALAIAAFLIIASGVKYVLYGLEILKSRRYEQS